MNEFAVDVGAPFYWVFLATAVVVITPITTERLRREALALIDILFISLLTNPLGGLVAIGYALVMHGTAAIAGASPKRPIRQFLAVSGAAVLVLVLFMAHKLAVPAHQMRSPAIRLLAALGFSYVALRSVELLRAGVEGRVSPLGWLDSFSYLFPFHMLAAGPVQSWDDFRAQHGFVESPDRASVLVAVDRIAHGLFKKFVLARIVELTMLTRFSAPWPYQLLEVQAYYLWVYLDFSAYSDLAVGAGGLLGVATPENFDRPLRARNIIQFWTRWHISLSEWVRRNCFIPLQLTMMRRTRGAFPLAIASAAFGISFIFVGLWHGISPRFLIWGAMHAAALICCNLYQRLLITRLGRQGYAEYLEHPGYRLAATVLTFEFVAMSLAFIVHPATAFLG